MTPAGADEVLGGHLPLDLDTATGPCARCGAAWPCRPARVEALRRRPTAAAAVEHGLLPRPRRGGAGCS